MLTVWQVPGTLVAVAPLMIRRFGPVRKLEFLGTGLSDYGDVLLHPEFGHDASQALLAYLAAHHRSWDLGDWSEVPADSPFLLYLRDHKPSSLRIELVPQTECPIIDLPASWEAYVSSLARKRRYYVSSFPRKFMREQAGSLEVVSGGPELKEALRTFYELHISRWSDKEVGSRQQTAGSTFRMNWRGTSQEANQVLPTAHYLLPTLSEEHTDPGFVPFLQEVCARCAEHGWLRIVSLSARPEGIEGTRVPGFGASEPATRLQGGDQTVASSLNFLLHGRWSAYMKGFDPRWKDVRPGTVLDALRIERAIEEGAAQFDFGRGAEEYKSGYGVRIERNTRVLLGTNAPRSLAAYLALLMRIRYRQRVR